MLNHIGFKSQKAVLFELKVQLFDAKIKAILKK